MPFHSLFACHPAFWMQTHAHEADPEVLSHRANDDLANRKRLSITEAQRELGIKIDKDFMRDLAPQQVFYL